MPTSRYADTIESLCRFSVQYQNPEGAIIDPFLHHEFQYATPYFAYAVGVLVSTGRAKDLLPNGIRAMEHATAQFGAGNSAIPNGHGEFFLTSLTEALEIYEPFTPREQFAVWKQRMKKPLEQILLGNKNNWQTYAMKGEWLRARAGLVSYDKAVETIEKDWTSEQKARIAPEPWFLYHDRSSDPDTLSVEAVGRGNLLALVETGYDGPSAAEMRYAAEQGTRTTLWLQDPSGQVPANGRTDDHVWVDVGYQLAFEVMAERAFRENNLALAGQFRHAAALAYGNIQRWRRSDGSWAGSFYITKNHFDPRERVGYQTATQYSNYTGSLMFHLAEALRTHKSEIEERPTPAEIGGYSFALDSSFATAFANAGGMQMQVNLRGDIKPANGNYWTPLGVVRFARAGWDTRLGPSDGALTEAGGITFAPTFFEHNRWLRMGDLSKRYRAEFVTTFSHPALVRCSVLYHPLPGADGPSFRDDFTLTPDGVLSELRKTSPGDIPWGVTIPLLENDGRPMVLTRSSHLAATAYSTDSDRENFIGLDPSDAMDFSGSPLRSTYGDLLPVRVSGPNETKRTFIYPANREQLSAEAVRQSFQVRNGGFRSVLGRVEGTTYIGRDIAGGEADGLDLDGDGKQHVRFDRVCRFLLRIRNHQIIAAEADRAVRLSLGSRSFSLTAFRPVKIG